MTSLTTSGPHQSVLLREAVEQLVVDPSGIYVDATFGRGGHTREILSKLGPKARLLALDRDSDAVAYGEQWVALEPRCELVLSNFSDLRRLIAERGWLGRISGLLLDLGVSSPQLDERMRGFSFKQDGPLDMRMSQDRGETAADWVNRAEAEEIARVLWEFGEERHSRRIAKAILRERELKPFETTRQLAELVRRTLPATDSGKDPSTRTFQAIRIHINDELGELQKLLADVVDLLCIGGRLVVISFHSLEDRIVKRFIRDASTAPRTPRDIPEWGSLSVVMPLVSVGKAIRATDAESGANPRARSAIMRVAQRVA